MRRASVVRLASAALALAAVHWPGSALAFDFGISGPAVHGNLAVYFVHGKDTGAAVPLTLERAAERGLANIYQSQDGPVEVENLSGHSVFAQFGSLLVGGNQDQVLGMDTILPPHAGRTPLYTFCVDPFRSSPRVGEAATTFSAAGALFPWRAAKLALLADSPDSKAARRMRQSAVWWSIDTVRSLVLQRLGEPMEPPTPAEWTLDTDNESALHARQFSWTTSLPLALRNRRLAQAQRPYVDALSRAGRRPGIIGAVFVINGKVNGAEIYQSHALFEQMWPKLLRANAIEAIARQGLGSQALPSTGEITAFLTAAQAGQSETALYAESVDETQIRRPHDRGEGTNWIHRSYLPKFETQAGLATADAILVEMLQAGEIDGRPISTLADDETVVVSRAANDPWRVTIRGSRPAWQSASLLSDSRRSSNGVAVVPRAVALLLAVLLSLFAVAVIQGRRRRIRAASAAIGRANETEAAPVTAPSMSPSETRAAGLVATLAHACAHGARSVARRPLAARGAGLRRARAAARWRRRAAA